MNARPFQTARWANGPAVVGWLERRENLEGLDETARKRLQRWRAGKRASVYHVDQLLVSFGRLLCDLPDDVWLPVDRDYEDHAA